jgi:hypothetical protein
MARVTDPAALVAALELDFGEGLSEGYRPGRMADGPARVREADPSRADGLIGEIETLWRTASSLPGLWGEHALPLEEACERAERFLETEYPRIPTPLRRRIVNAVGHHLWKCDRRGPRAGAPARVRPALPSPEGSDRPRVWR